MSVFFFQFGALRDKARALGCDVLATGHYARLFTPGGLSTLGGGAAGSLMGYTAADTGGGFGSSGGPAARSPPGLHLPQLWSARDLSKDQSYFLSGAAAEQLVGVRFPLGDLASKAGVVRQLAACGPPGLARVAAKKDSVGLCFVGQVGGPLSGCRHLWGLQNRGV
jgi:tRNA-specific 2-thiouridylase